MNGRASVTPQQRILKQLTHELVLLCGGYEAAAAIPGVRVSWQQLQNYCHMDKPLLAPIDVIAALEVVAGQPLVTQELARLSGWGLIRRVKIASGELAARMATIGKECGEAFSTWATGISDGRLSGPELVRLAHDLAEIEQAAIQAQAAVQHLLGDAE